MSVLKKIFDSTLLRYGLVGVLNTLFGLFMIYCAKYVGGGDVIANLFGYCCGLLLGFKLNAQWTFRYHGRLSSVFYIFCVVILSSYLLNLSIVLMAINLFSVESYQAQALGIIPYTLASYLGCRIFVFSHNKSVN